MNNNQVLELLKSVNYPGFSRDIVSFGMVDDVKIDGKTDLYAMGLILFEVLTGKIRAQNNQPPIEANNVMSDN